MRSGSSDSNSVSISVSNVVINTTDETSFVSVTIDAGQLIGSFDFSNEELIYFAQQFAPFVLRVGGTYADYTYYEVGNEDPCNNLPPANTSHWSYHCLSMNRMNELIEFSNKFEGTKLIFGLSAGYPTVPQDMSIPWNYTNTQQLLQYLHSKGYTSSDIYGFELGNELGPPQNG